MTRRVIVAGGALGAIYWKPIQAGLLEEEDKQAVLRLWGLSE
jgi:dethiobiotin synthetase